MKAVLISIQPKWCELIASGRKTVEVRKTRPKIETPFKVYIYCTLPPKEELFTHGCIREYANELIRLQDGRIVYDYGMRLCCDPEDRPYSQDNFLCKKVIGEFVCDCILSHCEMSNADIAEQQGCIKRERLLEYAGGKELYGWHISDLVIYDKPKALGEFSTICEGLKPYQCDKCEYSYTESNESIGVYHECCCNNLKPLKRPPQSWCYCEPNGSK